MRESIEKNQNNFNKEIRMMSQEEFNVLIEKGRDDLLGALGLPRNFLEAEQCHSARALKQIMRREA